MEKQTEWAEAAAAAVRPTKVVEMGSEAAAARARPTRGGSNERVLPTTLDYNSTFDRCCR